MFDTLEFVVEHNDHTMGWFGTFWSSAMHAHVILRPPTHNIPFAKLAEFDPVFFAKLQAREFFGLPYNAASLTTRCVNNRDATGFFHMPLRKFIELKLSHGELLAEAAATRLAGKDPIVAFANPIIDVNTTLTEDTRVVGWFYTADSK